MRQLERRQIVLLAILGVLIVAFLLWKVVLSGGGDSSTTVEPATVTTVANGQVQSSTDPNATAGSSATGSQSGTPVTQAPVDDPVVVGAYRDPFAPAG
jgi:hypothetical protein